MGKAFERLKAFTESLRRRLNMDREGFSSPS
jgi:hypothetical protein